MKMPGGKGHFKKDLLAGPEVGPRTEHRIVVRSASPLEHLLSFFLSLFLSSFFIRLMFFVSVQKRMSREPSELLS